VAVRKSQVGRVWFHKNYFRGWNWFEIGFLIASIVVPIAVGIPLGSGPIEIISANVTLIAAILFAKGKIEGYIFAFTAIPLYMIIAWHKQLFGELIIQAAIVYPLVLYGFINWWRFRSGKSSADTHTLVGHTSWREILIVVFSQLVLLVGYYFLLQYFGTRFLVLSSLSISAAVIGNYLIARRCQFGPGVFIPSDIILIILWSFVIADGGGGGAAVKLVMPIMFLVNDIYGVFEWRALAARQKKSRKKCEKNTFDPTFH